MASSPALSSTPRVEDFQNDLALVGSIAAVPNILDVVCRTTGMGFAAVARVTEDRWIACRTLDKIGFGLGPGDELKVETTICHEIRQHQEPVVIDEVAGDPAFCDHATPRMYGLQSYISVPILLADGRFFGTLCAIDPKPAKVNTPETIGMFTLFAELIAQHIDAGERVALTEARLQAEREAALLREQFIAVLGHDLRNPLGALSVGTLVLKESATDERALTLLAMMEKSVARMSELIEDVMDFARGRLGGGIMLDLRSDVPVEKVLGQTIEETRSQWPDRDIEAIFSVDHPLSFDRRRLSQLFANLLGNAIKHGKRDAPILVRACSGDGNFELSVTNAADPIPLEVRDRLFQPFTRGGKTEYQQGLGLGLYIASEIAKGHGGSLEVSSDEDATTFTFRMPANGALLPG
ncbi:GAF domain-containing sensor histidine kinase [Luteolibacter luteus]|uniref:histidine kinase n=1 Tax=Luteolibacter luteus TaxID=2728835 RepID=A0A858RNC4_9BACT|nr:GAF domain-containing sensor histidine kinase [Luteolibacter luteus]QJE97660.1 GAF domain-containing sensor histidine kinase [Luteolibacter luteus]